MVHVKVNNLNGNMRRAEFFEELFINVRFVGVLLITIYHASNNVRDTHVPFG